MKPPSQTPSHKRKITIIGDDGVDKTSLMISYTSGVYLPSNPFHPEMCENCTLSITHQKKVYHLAIWDAPCGDEYANLRPLAYKETYVFLLCFSLVDWGTYENVRTKWFPEVSTFDPDAKVILVGTKLDLRDTQDRGEGEGEAESQESVDYERGEALAKEIGAEAYWECSAVAELGVSKVFEEAIHLAVTMPARRGRRERRGMGSLGCVIA